MLNFPAIRSSRLHIQVTWSEWPLKSLSSPLTKEVYLRPGVTPRWELMVGVWVPVAFFWVASKICSLWFSIWYRATSSIWSRRSFIKYVWRLDYCFIVYRPCIKIYNPLLGLHITHITFTGPDCSEADEHKPGLKVDRRFNFSCIKVFVLLTFCGVWEVKTWWQKI